MDVEKRRIIVFIVVTYALTWSFEIGALWPALQEGGAAGSLLALVPMIFPALGVVITRLATHESFGHALLRPVRFRQTWYLWALGAFGTAGLIALGAALWFALNPADFDPSSPLLAARLVRMQRAGKESLLTVSNDDKDQQTSTPVPPVGARP